MNFEHAAVAALDRAGERLAAAGRGRPEVDRAAYLLSEAGTHSALWHAINLADLVVGGAIASRRLGPTAGRAHRVRAARRSVVLGAEQVVVNGAVKTLFRRVRPGHVTDHPHDLRTPRTSSFPSGHASAGACAATLLSADLGAAPAWWMLAAAVAWSRVHVGAHHTTDVVGGALLGRRLGRLAGLLWPPPED